VSPTTDAAIVVEGVRKTFRVARDPLASVKDRIFRLGRGGVDVFTALDGIDLTVTKGETIAILGHNGSGKSTLLKCIAGILTPSSGTVRVRGRLASLLELGAGFHPDLTGRENVYVNAAFFGLTRREIESRMDAIIDFAELGQFFDEPVKHYSSGMYVRLGFAVAVNLDPDVLLVDEVLAVGDEVFQLKCLARIKSFQDEGRTIVFVTHQVDTVHEICTRAVVLDHGHVVADGRPGEAIRTLREHLHAAQAPRYAHLHDDLRISGISIDHRHRDERPFLLPGESATVTVSIDARTPLAHPMLLIEVGDRNGRVVHSVDTDRLGIALPALSGEHQAAITLSGLWLLDGDYPVTVRLIDRTTGRVLASAEAPLHVTQADRADGIMAIGVEVDLH
jgi:ABC-2 type transport system ATP-binding protein